MSQKEGISISGIASRLRRARMKLKLVLIEGGKSICQTRGHGSVRHAYDRTGSSRFAPTAHRITKQWYPDYDIRRNGMVR